MIYRVRIEHNPATPDGKLKPTPTVVFDGELSGEGVGQVGRIADQIRGGFQAGMGGNVVVRRIDYVSGMPKVKEDVG